MEICAPPRVHLGFVWRSPWTPRSRDPGLLLHRRDSATNISYHSGGPIYVPGTRQSHILSHFLVPATLRGRYYYYVYFTHAYVRVYVMCPRIAASLRLQILWFSSLYYIEVPLNTNYKSENKSLHAKSFIPSTRFEHVFCVPLLCVGSHLLSPLTVVTPAILSSLFWVIDFSLSTKSFSSTNMVLFFQTSNSHFLTPPLPPPGTPVLCSP